MEEHDIIITNQDINREDEHVPKGSVGTIVALYNSNEAYEVEFDNCIVITVYPHEITKDT